MTRTRTPRPYEVHWNHYKTDGWIEIVLDYTGQTYRAQAQVFGAPSRFGIGAPEPPEDEQAWREYDYTMTHNPPELPPSARISRLAITHKLSDWSRSVSLYNYDRGLDYDKTPPGLLDTVIGYVLQETK